MADTTALKNRIRAAIKANDNQEITGPVLQQALLDIVDELNGATETEASARQSGDSTLQQSITAENNRAEGAESTLQQNITAEKNRAEGVESTLQGLIDGITDNIKNGYVYAGIATPSSTPATGKVFYLALTPGMYTNFGSTEVSHGINILKYNGSAWSLDAFIGIDVEPVYGSKNLSESGGTHKVVEIFTDKLYQYTGRRNYKVDISQSHVRIIYLDFKAGINYYITCYIPSAINSPLYFEIYDNAGNKKNSGNGWVIAVGDTSLINSFLTNDDLTGGYIRLYCSSEVSDVDISIISDEGNSINSVKSWILNEAFIPSSITRDSDGNVTNVSGTWPDGIPGTLTLTRDANGNVTQVNALRTNLGRVYLNISWDSNGNVSSASFS